MPHSYHSHTHTHLHIHIPPVIIPTNSVETYAYRHSYNPDPFEFPEHDHKEYDEIYDETIIQMINSLCNTVKTDVVIKIYEKDNASTFLQKIEKNDSEEWKLFTLNNTQVCETDAESDEETEKLDYHYDITELIQPLTQYPKHLLTTLPTPLRQFLITF